MNVERIDNADDPEMSDTEIHIEADDHPPIVYSFDCEAMSAVVRDISIQTDEDPRRKRPLLTALASV